MPEIDVEQIGVLAPQLVVQLGKLTRAIMCAVEHGTKFPLQVHLEAGNAVALLVKCIKPETENGNSEANNKDRDQAR